MSLLCISCDLVSLRYAVSVAVSVTMLCCFLCTNLNHLLVSVYKVMWFFFCNTIFLFQGVRNIASVCLQIGYPTLASIPHSVINGYKRVLAVSVETDYSFPLAEKVNLSALLCEGNLYQCRLGYKAAVVVLFCRSPCKQKSVSSYPCVPASSGRQGR